VNAPAERWSRGWQAPDGCAGTAQREIGARGDQIDAQRDFGRANELAFKLRIIPL
jgi:hypothetical protein